jgi:nitroimidazol reductase NimA-like FMN-containing flavoprotein (pyridoxamine 5'-phosphate oxidase superfamily)
MKPLPAEYEALLREPNAAVIGTVTSSGKPNTVATWYLWDEGRLIVNMDAGRKRLAWMRERPDVSLTVLMEDWSAHISLHGRVTEFVGGEQGMDDIDRISRHYTGRPYRLRDRERVSAYIQVSAWHAWGF